MTGQPRDEIAAYADAVAAALADLPTTVRQGLLDDLPGHLAEVVADDGGSLTLRLGTPQAYAAELRAAAGLVGGFPDPPAPEGAGAGRNTAGGHWSAVRALLAAADARFGATAGRGGAGDLLVLLRPAWWVLRGYLAAMLVAYLLDDSGQPRGVLPRIGGSEVAAVLLLAAAVLGSIWLGRRTPTLTVWPRYALHSAAVLLVLVAVNGFVTVDRDLRDAPFADVSYEFPYGGVTDVYVYDDEGRPLTGVHLFDQDGNPLRFGVGYCESDSDTPTSEPAEAYPRCPSGAPFRVAPVPAPSR